MMYRKSGLTLIFLVSLTACISTIVSGSWKSENYARFPLNNILVLGAGENDTARRIYESDMVSRLRNLGIKAESVHALFPDEDPLKKGVILDLARDKQIDTLLVTKVTRKKNATEKRAYTTGNVYLAPRYYLDDHPYRPYPFYNDWYGYYHGVGTTTTTYTFDYVILNLESNLYDIQGGELIWSAELEATHESRISATIKDINRATLNQLIRDGVIKK